MTCPYCGATASDRRAHLWRIRVRLYAADKPEEPIADSDPELAADADGTLTLRGLPAVATYVCDVAQGYHGAPCHGLELATLRRKLNGLRPTLHRRGGDATWRLGYTTDERGAERHWRARVSVCKEEGAGGGDKNDTVGVDGRRSGCVEVGDE